MKVATTKRRSARDELHAIVLDEADWRCEQHHLEHGTKPSATSGILDLKALEVISELQAQLDKSRRHWAIAARLTGTPWSAIGDALGITRQAAQKVYGPLVEQANDDEAHGWPWWHRHDHGTCTSCSRPLAGVMAGRKNERCTFVLVYYTADEAGHVVHVCQTCYKDPATPHKLATEPML